MRLNVSKNVLFLWLLVLILLTDVVIFGGVAYNRYVGEARSITLSEREVTLPYYRRHNENSGLSLRLSWSALGKKDAYTLCSRQPYWLDSAKLKALGFDLANARDSAGYGQRELSKAVLIVLEYDGDVYKQALEWTRSRLEAKRVQYQEAQTQQHKRALELAQKDLNRLQTSQSRLFAIDAGIDLQQLRKQYTDASRYIIVKGIVRPMQHSKEVPTGYIEDLSIENFHVSLKHRRFFEKFISKTDSFKKEDTPPRYEVTLAYGSRLEPWIVSAKAILDIDLDQY